MDEAGLASAVRWYVDGFAKRSGIQIKLEVPSKLDRLQEDIEGALFRALQDALTNVHRHSNSSAVDVCLTMETKQVRLEIEDNGKGIPENTLKRLVDGLPGGGVGLPGMRERIRELGGTLSIRSDKSGTSLKSCDSDFGNSGDSEIYRFLTTLTGLTGLIREQARGRGALLLRLYRVCGPRVHHGRQAARNSHPESRDMLLMRACLCRNGENGRLRPLTGTPKRFGWVNE